MACQRGKKKGQKGVSPLTQPGRMDRLRDEIVSAASDVPTNEALYGLSNDTPGLAPGSFRRRGTSPARSATPGTAWAFRWEMRGSRRLVRPPRLKRIGGDASAVQEKKRKYRHQQRH